jgi:hypothetical protein
MNLKLLMYTTMTAKHTTLKVCGLAKKLFLYMPLKQHPQGGYS